MYPSYLVGGLGGGGGYAVRMGYGEEREEVGGVRECIGGGQQARRKWSGRTSLPCSLFWIWSMVTPQYLKRVSLFFFFFGGGGGGGGGG